jgi:ATP-binding cassette subfamily B protein
LPKALAKEALASSLRSSSLRAPPLCSQCLLNDGHIAEKGTHEELMALKGEYAQLFEIQAMNYR